MPEFQYRVVAKDGKARSGKIKASNLSEAKVFLKRRGFKISYLASKKSSKLFEGETPVIGEFLIRNEKGGFQFLIGNQNPSSKDVILFTKQLATMIGSGVSLIQAVSILKTQQESRGLRSALYAIQESVENGATLSSSMSKFPSMFDNLYVAMVAAGEASGNLDNILKKLVTYNEKAQKIKSQLKSAMAYPAIVLTVAVAVVSGLLIFVVPVFAKQFTESGRKLPDLTQFVVDISDFFTNYWYFIFSILGTIVVGLRYWKNTPRGREIFDKYILNAPIIGSVIRKISIGRFCSTMSSMMSSGVNLLQALTICAASSGNKSIENFVLNVRAGLEKGQTFSQPLSEGDLFPQMVISMIQVGEATGSLDDMLTKVSDLYEEEVDIAVKTMLSMIEPIMIVFIGGIIAFVVIAMYLPIFDLAGGVTE